MLTVLRQDRSKNRSFYTRRSSGAVKVLHRGRPLGLQPHLLRETSNSHTRPLPTPRPPSPPFLLSNPLRFRLNCKVRNPLPIAPLLVRNPLLHPRGPPPCSPPRVLHLGHIVPLPLQHRDVARRLREQPRAVWRQHRPRFFPSRPRAPSLRRGRRRRQGCEGREGRKVMFPNNALEPPLRPRLMHLEVLSPERLRRVRRQFLPRVEAGVARGKFHGGEEGGRGGTVVDAPVEGGTVEAAFEEDEREVVGHGVAGFAVVDFARSGWVGGGRKGLHEFGGGGAVGSPEELVDEGGGFEACADEEEEGDDVADLVIELGGRRGSVSSEGTGRMGREFELKAK